MIFIFALLCCCTTVSPVSSITYTVHINKNGSDQPQCLLGNGSCCTLEYVLTSISKPNFTRTNFSIFIYYSQHVYQSRKMKFHNMELKGIGMPVLSIRYFLEFRNFHSFSVDGFVILPLYWIDFSHGSIVKFSNCLFERSNLMRFYRVHVVRFSGCAFNSSLFHTNFRLYGIQNTVFDGCTFQSLTAIPYLIDHDNAERSVLLVHIINCSFERIVGGILSVSSSIESRHAKIMIENSSISKTENDDYLIKFAWDTFFYEMRSSLTISITNSTFINNILRSVFNIYKSSIISISCLSGNSQDKCIIPAYIYIMNIIFKNNLGTALFFNELPKYGKKILNSVFFFNNTGLYGAGITIQSSEVELQNVSFIKNTALYGGSIFISSQQCSYFGRNNHTDIHFSENNGLANIYIDSPYCAKNVYLGGLIDSHPEYFMTGPSKLILKTENKTIDVFYWSKDHFSCDCFGQTGTQCHIMYCNTNTAV